MKNTSTNGGHHAVYILVTQALLYVYSICVCVY